MIELQMVRRMIKRGLWLGPVVVVILWIVGDARWALSAVIGLLMTLGNLYFAARIIGTVADKTPQMLLAAAMVSFALGLAILTAIAFGLQAADIVYFPVTGLVLVGSHLVLVLWEATGAYGHVESNPPGTNAHVRS